MKYLRKIFNDWPTRLAGIIFLLVFSLFIFNTYSDLPEKYPLFGVFNFSLVPILFVAGGVIFSIAIFKLSRGSDGMQAESHSPKLAFLIFSGAIAIMLLIVGGYQLVEFTDSTGFCGRLCHEVMYPEYTAYQDSPHSRVTCSQCHVGSGADYLVKSKLSGIPLIFATLTGNYERPVSTPVLNLRPARETCEQCHRPERFAGDIVRVHTSYRPNEENTQEVVTKILRVGGGESEVARDIHWHIAANVWYLPANEKRQEIIWVGVENSSGKLTEYIDQANKAKISEERINNEKRLMDCIDCHNRATHVFQSPSDLIDSAIFRGKIDSTLPYIKREGLKVLDPPNSSLDQAYSRLDTIKDFYKTSYPKVLVGKEESINKAITQLKEIARLTTFPDMKIDWKTYPDNAGHKDSKGCFRCHGKLDGISSDNKGRRIDDNCKLCHYGL